MSSKHISKIFAGITLVFLMLLLGSCNKENSLLNANWAYADLRALDAIDSADPNLELLALYYRASKPDGELQFRLDLLDLTAEDPLDIIIALDAFPGGTNDLPGDNNEVYDNNYWDIFIYIHSFGTSQILDDNGEIISNVSISVEFDTFLDATFISLPVDLLPNLGNMTVLAMVSDSIDNEVKDVIGPIQTDSPPPSPIPVLFLFWDALGGSTPAQSLRSWDGAHTGPDRNRYGFRYLAEAIEEFHVPVFVYDDHLETTLSSLQYLGQRKYVLYILKEYIYFVDNKKFVNGNYGYAQYYFSNSDATATLSGLSKDLITRLFLSLPSSKDSHVYVIGSTFLDSNWGSPDAVWATLKYISQHPWIHPISKHELRSAFINEISQTNTSSLSAHDKSNLIYFLQPQLWDIDGGRINNYQSVNNSNIQPISGELCDDQLDHLSSAAVWINQSHEITDCSLDIDSDGQNECIFATEKLFTTYELTGGYLVFAFYYHDGHAHQLIGPSCLLDPQFNKEYVKGNDNDQYAYQNHTLGALVDAPTLFSQFDYEFNQDSLILMNDDMAIRKSFTLDSIHNTIGMSVKYFNNGGSKLLTVPIILDPWTRFEPEWPNLYNLTKLNGKWNISIKNSIQLEATSYQEISVVSFLDPIKFMSQPEDPNLDYSKGFFLPYQLILIETDIIDQFELRIKIQTEDDF